MLQKLHVASTGINVIPDGCTDCRVRNEKTFMMEPAPLEFVGQALRFGQDASLWFCRKCNTLYIGEPDVLEKLISYGFIQRKPDAPSVSGHEFFNRMVNEISCGYGDNLVREIGNRILYGGNSLSFRINEMVADLGAVREKQDKLLSDFTRAKEDMLSVLRSKVLNFSLT